VVKDQAEKLSSFSSEKQAQSFIVCKQREVEEWTPSTRQ